MLSTHKKQILSHGLVSFVFIAMAAFLAWTSRFYIADPDEGMLWSAAMKIAEGQVMYRDFFEFWTPGAVYVLGWLFNIFGFNIWVSRAVYVVLSMTIYILLYLVLKQTRFGLAVRLISVLLFFAITSTHLALNHHWFGIAGLLASLYFLLQHFSQPGKSRYLILSGTFAGLTAIFMQYEGVIAIVSGWIVLSFSDRITNRLKALSLFTAPIAILGLTLVALFGMAGALDDLFYSTVYFPLVHYRESNVGYPSALWIYQSLLLVLFVWLMIRRKWLSYPIKIIVVYATVIQLIGLSTVGFMHNILLAFLFNSLFIYMISKLLTKGSFSKLKSIRFNQLFAQVLDKVGTTDTKKFAPALLLSLLLLAYGARMVESVGVLWSKSIVKSNYSEQIHTPAGSILVPRTVHHRMEQIISFVDTHIPEGQPVYFGPYSSYYNFLTNRPNPLPYSQLTPDYNPGYMFANSVSILQEQQPPYIVLLPRESTFPFGRDNDLYRYIEEHYEIVVKIEDIDMEYNKSLASEPPDAIWQHIP